MSAYKGFTEAQAKAHKKYMESIATIQVRTKDEMRELIKARAADLGKSVNEYILDLVKADLLQADPAGDMPGGSSGRVTPVNTDKE